MEALPENAIASIATEVGRVLSGPSPASSSRSQVVGIGERMANSAVQDMLSQYGTAKLTFNSKGEGAVDFLLPIFDFGESLYFTQLGYRVSKDRDIFNFGLGTRFFTEQSMIGFNSKRPAKAVLTVATGYSAGRATRHGSSSLTRFTGQSAITFNTCRR